MPRRYRCQPSLVTPAVVALFAVAALGFVAQASEPTGAKQANPPAQPTWRAVGSAPVQSPPEYLGPQLPRILDPKDAPARSCPDCEKAPETDSPKKDTGAAKDKDDESKSEQQEKSNKNSGKSDKEEKKEKSDDKKEKSDDEKKKKELTDSQHEEDCYGLKSLFDSLRPPGEKGKAWYDKLSIRGYTQLRFGRAVDQDPFGADPNLFGDRSINGNAENFSFRRARLILFGDVSDHLYFYFQPDFANTTVGSSTSTFFTQLRDLYGDVYVDKEKVNRFRVGLSKVPYGWENMQSSQNRVPLDRTDPINSATPVERDLGVFYYWTPEREQKLLRELVDGGLKGSGNYGVFGIGVYNGQGGAQLEQNLNLHSVARLTCPYRFENGQVVETSIQGYTGEFVVEGAPIRPLGMGSAKTPANTRASGDRSGLLDQRLAGTFVYYPQPWGLQAEWNWGQGPGLNDEQTAVETRGLQGGYVMAMYKFDTARCAVTGTPCGIFTPYVRYQFYRGGYKSFANAPYGTNDQWNLGVEWQIRKEMELTIEYTLIDGVNLNAINEPGVVPYRNFDGAVLRLQFQVNY